MEEFPMANEESVKLLTDIVASFVCHISKKLPDDRKLLHFRRFSMRP